MNSNLEELGVVHNMGTHDYTQISKEFLLNPTLSLKAKGMLCLLLSLPSTQKRYYKYHLQEFSRDRRDGTSAAFEELVKAGYVTVIPNVTRKPQDWKYLIKDCID
jgi:hypothetical protein